VLFLPESHELYHCVSPLNYQGEFDLGQSVLLQQEQSNKRQHIGWGATIEAIERFQDSFVPLSSQFSHGDNQNLTALSIPKGRLKIDSGTLIAVIFNNNLARINLNGLHAIRRSSAAIKRSSRIPSNSNASGISWILIRSRRVDE
jgi:hypothetical protein